MYIKQTLISLQNKHLLYLVSNQLTNIFYELFKSNSPI